MSLAVPLAVLWATLSGCGVDPVPEKESDRLVQAGRNFTEEHRYAEARHACEEALALDSLDAEAHCALGGLDARLGHVERAVRAYRAAIAADSTYHRARHNLAVIEADRGHLPLAIELLERIPTYVPALRTLPLFYAKQGRYDLAEKGLHAALEEGGENIDVRQQFGRLYLRQGRYDEARAALDLALAQDSTSRASIGCSPRIASIASRSCQNANPARRIPTNRSLPCPGCSACSGSSPSIRTRPDQDLPQMRRQAQGDRLHRGSRRDRHHP